MPSVSRRQALAYAVVLLALLALVGRSLAGGGDAVDDPAQTGAAEQLIAVEEPAEDAADSEVLLVHVAGAVREPGVYELKAGSRVADALRQAGGARARAWLDSINLAAQLVDGQQVVVPTRPAAVSAGGGAIGSDLAGTPATTPAGPPSSGPISLSTATARELEQLPGVGPVTAEKIVAHREQHGPFRAVEELTAISGVGPARVEALRDLVTP